MSASSIYIEAKSWGIREGLINSCVLEYVEDTSHFDSVAKKTFVTRQSYNRPACKGIEKIIIGYYFNDEVLFVKVKGIDGCKPSIYKLLLSKRLKSDTTYENSIAVLKKFAIPEIKT